LFYGGLSALYIWGAGMKSDFKWIIPASVGLGALLAVFQPEFFITGWLAFSLLILLGLLALVSLWRWGGGTKTLAWIVALAFILRLAAGVTLTTLLPVVGSGSDQQKAGYIFTDSWRRDQDAWALAKSDHPVWSGSQSQEFVGDQYGGLMAMSAFAYRYLSPDAHRPILIILIGALVSAMAIPLLWKASDAAWGLKVAVPAAWILALYPESILLGSSQMREPFLITFITMTIWGFVDWIKNHHRVGWIWLTAGMIGLMLFSPSIALLALIMFAGWFWFSGEHRRSTWWLVPLVAVVFTGGILLMTTIFSKSTVSFPDPYSVLTSWFYDASRWDFYQLAQSSGIVQYLMGILPGPLQVPFMVGYGVTQPLLPANLFEPTIWISRIYGTLRSLGWYVLIPLLFYGLIAAWKLPDRRERRVWLWFGFMIWIWIILVSIRAGADQWDNPRYRVIMLPWQALFAAYAWSFWREFRDRWLPRIVAIEVAFLVLFSLWYVGRYYHIIPKFNLLAYAALLLVFGAAFLIGDVIYEHSRQPRS
jgi:hypothetical protein